MYTMRISERNSDKNNSEYRMYIMNLMIAAKKYQKSYKSTQLKIFIHKQLLDTSNY